MPTVLLVCALFSACGPSDAEELARLRTEESFARLDVRMWEDSIQTTYSPLIPDDQQRDVLAAFDSLKAAEIRLDLVQRDINRLLR